MTKTYELKITKPIDDSIQEKEVIKKEIASGTISNVETNEQIVSPGITSGVKKTIGTLATVYATSQLALQPIMREKTNKAAISGDYVQSENIRIRNAEVNKYVGLGFEVASIAVATMVNPVMGGVALAGSVVKHTQQAINREQQNRMINANANIESFINGIESSRFIDVKKGR